MFSNSISKTIALFLAFVLHIGTISVLIKLHQQSLRPNESKDTPKNYIVFSETAYSTSESPARSNSTSKQHSHSSQKAPTDTKIETSTLPTSSNEADFLPATVQQPLIVLGSSATIVATQTYKQEASSFQSNTAQSIENSNQTNSATPNTKAEINPDQRAVPSNANPQPIYPESAKRRQQQGSVSLTVNVNQKGEVSQLRVIKSSGFRALDQSALNTVAHWRFKAAQYNGTPIDDTITLSFDFYLKP